MDIIVEDIHMVDQCFPVPSPDDMEIIDDDIDMVDRFSPVPSLDHMDIVDDDIDMVDQFFHLNEASLSPQHISSPFCSNGDARYQKHEKGEIPGFVPITGQKIDQWQQHMQESTQNTNRTGGDGPFVYPHSGNVFMGRSNGRRLKLFVPDTNRVRGVAKRNNGRAVKTRLETAKGAAQEETADTALDSPMEDAHEEARETPFKASEQKIFEPTVETTHDWMATRQLLLAVMQEDEF
ncbi:hypothetical protein GGR57DRAFT_504576 [Xylariaceae sp. FL1272]|nr:hypothetical protein GGR57DRAFT_504576 [Xylariaceae sp. FL1272]